MKHYRDENEDPEEDYEEEIKEEFAVQIAELFKEKTSRKPSYEDKEIISEFIFNIYSDESYDVSDYFINKALAMQTLNFPHIRYGKKEVEKFKFMSHFYCYIFENATDSEAKDETLDYAVAHLRKAYRCFSKMDPDDIKERIYLYEEIITQWYFESYSEIPIPVNVDDLPLRTRERIKDKTLEMIAVTHSSMAKGDVRAVENNLHSLGNRFERYKF